MFEDCVGGGEGALDCACAGDGCEGESALLGAGDVVLLVLEGPPSLARRFIRICDMSVTSKKRRAIGIGHIPCPHLTSSSPPC